MRLKLDENLPEAARLVAASLGHDVDTVIDEDLTGAGDPTSLPQRSESSALSSHSIEALAMSVDTRLAAIQASPSSVLSTRDVETVTSTVRSFLSNE